MACPTSLVVNDVQGDTLFDLGYLDESDMTRGMVRLGARACVSERWELRSAKSEAFFLVLSRDRVVSRPLLYRASLSPGVYSVNRFLNPPLWGLLHIGAARIPGKVLHFSSQASARSGKRSSLALSPSEHCPGRRLTSLCLGLRLERGFVQLVVDE
jgi:hypothetical protein